MSNIDGGSEVTVAMLGAYIKKDGTTTTTASIPFAEGISIGANKIISMTPNIAIGAGALTTPGPSLTGAIVIGVNAGTTMIGDQSIAIGTNALNSTTSGAGASVPNIAIGTNALTSMTDGNNNLAIGYEALRDLTGNSYSGNLAIGHYSLTQNATGPANLAIGYRALTASVSDEGNISIGYNSGATLNGGDSNTWIGYEGGALVETASMQTAVGYEAGGNSQGNYNTALGAFALRGRYLSDPHVDITASGVIGIGYNAGATLAGDYSIAIGYMALDESSAGANTNIAIGANTLGEVSTGGYNTALGHEAGFTQTTATGNVLLGYNAGYYETGSNKLFIDNAKRSNEADARTKALVYGIFDAATANQSLTVNGLITGAEGVKVPESKKLIIGDTGSNYVWSSGGSVVFLIGDATTPNIDFTNQATGGRIRFGTLAGGDTTYDSAGVTHAISSGSYWNITDHSFGDPHLNVDIASATFTIYDKILTSLASTTALRVTNGSGTDTLVADTTNRRVQFPGITASRLTATDSSNWLVPVTVSSPLSFSGSTLSLGTVDISANTNLAATTPIVLTGDTLSHADTAVTPASYTRASITVDQKGHITAASSGGTIDISADTNLSATAPITLTGDAIGIDQTANYSWTGTHTFTGATRVTSTHTTAGTSSNNFDSNIQITATGTDTSGVYNGADIDIDYTANAAGGLHVPTARGINIDIDFVKTASLFFGLTAQIFKGDLTVPSGVTLASSDGSKPFDVQITDNSGTSFTQGAYDFRLISSNASGATIALRSYSNVTGNGNATGYQGYADGDGTGECIGVEGFVASNTNTSRVAALSGLAGTNTALNKKMSVYGQSGHLLINGGSGIFTNSGTIPSGITTTHLDFLNNTGELYVKGASEFDGIIYSDGGITMADAKNIVLDTTTGTIIGTAITQKLGFYNVTPIAQRAGAAQAAVATTGATNVAPYGYTTAAQADAIVTLVNELRAWAVAQGFIKGAA